MEWELQHKQLKVLHFVKLSFARSRFLIRKHRTIFPVAVLVTCYHGVQILY